jgi:PAS domain S-box-containing protein
MVQVINAERAIQETSPEKQRSFRNRSRTVLEGGLLINIVMALLIGLFFTRSIGARLKIILENTERLSRRQPLKEKLRGEDELSKLDTAFHNMSNRLIQDEAMLQASERRVRSIIEQLPVGLLLVAPDETIEFANSTMQRMTKGRSNPLELKGRKIGSLFANSASRLQLDQFVSTSAQTKVIELDLIRADGDIVPVEFSIAKYSSQSEASTERELNLAILLDVSGAKYPPGICKHSQSRTTNTVDVNWRFYQPACLW